jgi:nicotinamide-nucleotide amidase
MRAEIVTTGTELLLGEIVNTNATYIARQLRDVGVDLYHITMVGDNELRIASDLEIALSRADVVITSGGLGPTVDDVTREAVARATGRPLELRPELLAQIESRFRRFGRRMKENNRRQAFLPQGAIPIENPVGTAPGFIVEDSRGTIISLPGVPREMEYLMESSVLPYLKKRMGGEQIILAKTLRTCAIGESDIDSAIADLMRLDNPTVGLAAHTGQADIRITAKAADRNEAESLIADLEAEIRARLGRYIYGEGRQTLEEVVVRMLAERDLSLALAETNTQGAIAQALREAAEGGRALSRAVVLGQGQAPELEALLPQDGQPDARTAAAIARELRQSAGADLGLVILGTAGEGEGLYGDRRGDTYVALAVAERTERVHYHYGVTDELTRRWVSLRALNVVRECLLEQF